MHCRTRVHQHVICAYCPISSPSVSSLLPFRQKCQPKAVVVLAMALAASAKLQKALRKVILVRAMTSASGVNTRVKSLLPSGS